MATSCSWVQGLLDSVQVDMILDPPTCEADTFYYEPAVASPPPADSPPPANPTPTELAALEASHGLMQAVTNHSDEPLLGLRASDGTITLPTEVAILRVRRSRREKTVFYELDGLVIKTRQDAADSAAHLYVRSGVSAYARGLGANAQRARGYRGE